MGTISIADTISNIRTVYYFIRSVVFFLLLPFYSPAQTILNGKVVETSTGNSIPYASIGLVKQNAGTNANENGEFKISCSWPDGDSLVISCIGYVTIRLPARDLLPNQVLSLSTYEKRLRPLIIKNQWVHSEVGGYKKYQDYCLTTVGYQWQVAKKITAPVANTCLQSVKIGISKNHKGGSTFRVHVFDFDSLTNSPGTLPDMAARKGFFCFGRMASYSFQ
jgi:hypothetical protein